MKGRGIIFVIILLFFAPILAFCFSGFALPYPEDTYISLHLGDSWKMSNGKMASGHLGDDAILSAGTPIFAAADGLVVRSYSWPSCDKYEIIDGVKKKTQSSHGWGGVVIIEHVSPIDYFKTDNSFLENSETEKMPKKVYSQYGHMANLQVQNGDVVSKGDIVGYVADMCMWGDHVHFEIKDSYSFENDILEGVGSGYSSVNKHAPHRYKPGYFVSLNKDVVSTSHDSLDKNIEDSSFLQKIKSFFSFLFPKNKVSADSEISITVQEADAVVIDQPKELPVIIKKEETPKKETVALPVLIVKETEEKLEKDIVQESIVPIQKTNTETKKIITDVTDTLRDVKQTIHEGLTYSSQQITRFFDQGGGGGSPPASVEEPVAENSDMAPNKIESFFLASPTSSLVMTTGTTTRIVGTKTSGIHSIVASIANEESQATFVSETEWFIDLALYEGSHEFIFVAKDSGGVVVSTSSHTFFLDTEPPIIHTIDAVPQDETAQALEVKWQAEDLGVGIDTYDVEYRTGHDEWHAWLQNTTSTQDIFIPEQGKPMLFRVRARDILGNVSDWEFIDNPATLDWPKTIVIHEVGWMGTRLGRDDDQWLELHNPTDTDIDIFGWSLSFSGYPVVFIKEPHIIPAHGYIVLESNDDNTLPNVVADGMYTGTMSMDGAHIVLQDAVGEIVDEVDASAGWFAGRSDGTYASMERRSSTLPGSLPTNWQTSDSISLHSRAFGGGVFFGSPKIPNTGYWYLYDIAHNYVTNNQLTLTKEQSPYIFDYRTHIPKSVTVTIEPGAVLVGIGKDAYIDVEGTLIANGTAENPIVFTSRYDNRFFSSEFLNMLPQESSPGDWSHILVQDQGRATIEHAEFWYGGFPHTHKTGWVYGNAKQAQVIANTGGTLVLNQSTFSRSFTHPIDLPHHSILWQDGVATTSISNTLFDGGYMAIKNNSRESGIHIQGNRFSNFTHAEGPVFSGFSFPTLLENVYTSNTFNGVTTERATFGTSTTLSSDQSYIFGNVTVSPGVDVVVEPGVSLAFRPRATWQIFGRLFTNGTEEYPVRIVPSVPATYWGNLIFEQGSEGVFTHTELIGGNHGEAELSKNGMVIGKNSTLVFTHVLFQDARRPGNMVFFDQSDVTIADSRFVWSSIKDIKNWVIIGIKMIGGILHIEQTHFFNMDRGIDTIRGTVGQLLGMDAASFVSTTIPWFPGTLFDSL